MLIWTEIKKLRFQNNLKQFQKIVGAQRQIMAIVKSNACAYGMPTVTKFCLSAGADWLASVNFKEISLIMPSQY